MYKDKGKLVKEKPTRYFRASLFEIPNEDGKIDTHVKVSFSKAPFKPEQFIPLLMGVAEAYAEELLTTNSKELVYDNFNSAFGTFLKKLVPDSYIYEHDEAHKSYLEAADKILSQPFDAKDTDGNKLAAYLLCAEILTKDVGLTPDTANLILSRRLGTLKPIKEGTENVGKTVEESKTE